MTPYVFGGCHERPSWRVFGVVPQVVSTMSDGSRHMRGKSSLRNEKKRAACGVNSRTSRRTQPTNAAENHPSVDVIKRLPSGMSLDKPQTPCSVGICKSIIWCDLHEGLSNKLMTIVKFVIYSSSSVHCWMEGTPTVGCGCRLIILRHSGQHGLVMT